jgi:hypothetical protein
LGGEIGQSDYPCLHALFHKGVAGLFGWVSTTYGFEPSDRYISKCHLCFDMRRHLVLEQGLTSRELSPKAFYENV